MAVNPTDQVTIEELLQIIGIYEVTNRRLQLQVSQLAQEVSQLKDLETKALDSE